MRYVQTEQRAKAIAIAKAEADKRFSLFAASLLLLPIGLLLLIGP